MAAEYIDLLMVEDNPGDVVLIEELLAARPMGGPLLPVCRLTHAATLGDAMEILRHRSFDIILLDFSLPDADGMDLLIRILCSARFTPVVVMSGQAEGDLAVRAIRAGAQDYLVKGNINRQWLARSLRFAIERNCLAKEIRKSSDFWEE